ncbi:DNA polymerase epsilon subunit B [Candida viswanathii]|uniref:DNA polymerase epsilon subunit B n=1 Tax=Candida viswanathii TaxID=5486 RepID=A0A367YM05_9ASCO|nr:DNA polymerase epsilon subunit B [Candida viswanathii]
MEPTTTSLPIKLRPANLRPIAFRIFSKKHGLNVNTEALAVLTDVISYKFGTDWKSVRSQQYLEEIAKIWKVEDRGLFIDADGLKQIVKDLNSKKKDDSESSTKAHRTDTIVDLPEPEGEIAEDDIDWRDYFKVLSPKDQPKSVFDTSRKQFDIIFKDKTDRSLLGRLQENLPAKVNSYHNRYSLIRDRLSRNESFQKSSTMSISALNSMKSGEKTSHEITLVKNMLGRDGHKFLLFGLLSKDANGEFILEDETDYIELNLTQTFKSPGSFYCLGMYFLVEGIYSASGGSSNHDSNYIGGCFYVSNMGHPPSERRDKSLDYYGHLDFLGIHRQFSPVTGEKTTKITKKYRRMLVDKESESPHRRIVFALGNTAHTDSMKKLLQRLENSIIESDENAPIAVVFTGSNSPNKEIFKQSLDKQFPNLFTKLKIVVVAGDLVLSGIQSPEFLNRPRQPNTMLTQNPTTIAYLSQEIIVMKDQVMSQLRKGDLNFGSFEERTEQNLSSRTKQARKLVKTILDQGYLAVGRGFGVVDLEYDHCFRLEPAPTMVVLHDMSFPQFDVTYNGCKVVNVATQEGNQFTYMEYFPASKSCVFREA